jgi:hypothetical protein
MVNRHFLYLFFSSNCDFELFIEFDFKCPLKNVSKVNAKPGAVVLLNNISPICY